MVRVHFDRFKGKSRFLMKPATPLVGETYDSDRLETLGFTEEREMGSDPRYYRREDLVLIAERISGQEYRVATILDVKTDTGEKLYRSLRGRR